MTTVGRNARPILAGRARFSALLALGLMMAGAGCSFLEEDQTTRDEDGSIVEGGELGAFTIQLGDCIGGELAEEVGSVDGVPCDEPHQFEVYHLFDLPEGDGNFPGDLRVGELADEGCLAAFEPFVGQAIGASVYDFFRLTPTQETWERIGDREVVCMVSNFDGTPKTGSAKGSGL